MFFQIRQFNESTDVFDNEIVRIFKFHFPISSDELVFFMRDKVNDMSSASVQSKNLSIFKISILKKPPAQTDKPGIIYT